MATENVKGFAKWCGDHKGHNHVMGNEANRIILVCLDCASVEPLAQLLANEGRKEL